MSDFLPQLLEKLKAAGLPVLEKDAELLYKTVSDHVKNYPYPNSLLRSLAPVLMLSLDELAKEQINKIDGQPG